MANPHSDSGFTFVNSTEPCLPKNSAVRSVIKRQAMKSVGAARKRHGQYGNHNRRQHPIFVDAPSANLPPNSTLTREVSGMPPYGSGGRENASFGQGLTNFEIAEYAPKRQAPERSHVQGPGNRLIQAVPSSHDGTGGLPDRVSEYFAATEASHRQSSEELATTPSPQLRRSKRSSPPSNHKRNKTQHAYQVDLHERRRVQEMELAMATTLAESRTGSLSLSRYEWLRVKAGFDILNISPLTSLHIGRAAVEYFITDPSRLTQLLRYKQWSYLSYLPSRYGHGSCLDHATDCVVARLRQMVSPATHYDEARVVSLYVKALKSLQLALDDPSQCLQPETLCATELLTLFELFDNMKGRAWIRHASGAARLIEHRGPGKFETEFEKALFMAHAGPIVTEALLNNTACFLETESWSAVFRSVILNDENFADRSETVVSLWILLSQGPAQFKETASIICSKSPSNTHPSPFPLTNRILQHRTNLQQWYHRFKALLSLSDHTNSTSDSTSDSPTTSPPEHECDKRLEIHGTYLSCLILKNRLLTALSPSRFQHLERETQNLASKIIKLREEACAARPQGGLFMTQTMGIAASVMKTAVEWGGKDVDWGIRGQEGNPGFIGKGMFERWCEMLGRKID